MMLDEVERRVAQIACAKDDDETAHGLEDDLFAEVLRAIADGCDHPAVMAEAALKSQEIGFCRRMG